MTKDELLFLRKQLLLLMNQYLIGLNDIVLQAKWENFLNLKIYTNLNDNNNWLEILKKFCELVEEDIKWEK